MKEGDNSALGMHYEQLEDAILAWCQAEAAIVAAVIVGSRALSDPPPDEWADLDVVVFATTPEVYAADQAWMGRLGPAWLTHLEPTGADDPEWFVLFNSGLKADFVFSRATPGARNLADLLTGTPYRTVFHRGLRVLYDATSPDPIPPVLPPAQERIRPTSGEFDHQVKAAFLLVNKAARLLVRRDLWRASNLVNCALKARTLTMLEWSAWSETEGSPPDTWHDGRHLARWASPDAVAALPATFGRYEADSLWTALNATLDLYVRLARTVAAAWGYTYPANAEAHLRDWLANSVSVALNSLRY